MAMDATTLDNIRQHTGDVNSGAPDVTDARIESVWTSEGSPTDTESVAYARVIVRVLEYRLAVVANDIAQSSDHGVSYRDHKFNRVQKLLDLWMEKAAGSPSADGATISGGEIALGLDTVEE